MPTDKELMDFYKDATRASTKKMLIKFEDAADDMIDKLHSDELHDAWHERVSSEQSKTRFASKLKKLSKSDVVTPMKEKGISAYTKATGLDSTAKKMVENGRPYREVAESWHKDKRIIRTDEDAEFNMLEMRRRMMAKKKEIDG